MSSLESPRRWFHLTPGRVILVLPAVVGLLWLSERFHWFAFNEKKGWTVLIALASVAAALLLMFVWFIAAVLFRRRFQFSIGSLLLLAIYVAMPCSWLATEMKKAKMQREVVEAIEKVKGWESYDWEADVSRVEPPQPRWLRHLLGDDFFTNVEGVGFATSPFDGVGANITDAVVERLEALPEVEELLLDDTGVTDAGLKHIRGMSHLRLLLLDGTHVTDMGLKYLEGLPQLELLSLSGGSVTDAGLEHVKGLIQLRSLYLSETRVTGRGLKCLQGLPQLQELLLDGTQVGDAGLEHLKGLVELNRLWLDHTNVSDAGLEHLRGLTQLRELKLADSHVTGKGAERLQEALPDCTIDQGGWKGGHNPGAGVF
ncbi:MAG: leucine-rich repeat domain-containing protein [Thermoguttaceae bacterium]